MNLLTFDFVVSFPEFRHAIALDSYLYIGVAYKGIISANLLR